jgi:hypothetical protein
MKLIYIILISIFLVPFASASANIIGLTSNSFNLGNTIELGGSISYSSNFKGYINLIAECQETINLDTALLDLKPNQEYRFSKSYTLTKEFAGTCDLKLKVIDLDERQIDEKEYGSISVSKDLIVTIDSRITRFQLGDTLNINGIVSKEKGLVTNGIATLTFKEKESPKFIETVKIQNGKFNFSRPLTLIPAGEYIINIRSQDEFGNEKLIENVFSFSVNNKISINQITTKYEYLPGEIVEIKGNVRGEISDSLTNLELKLKIDDDDASSLTLEDSKQPFSFEYTLANNIKSGSHNFSIYAKDNKGNYNTEYGTFYVKAIPTTFKAELTTVTDFVPEDTVKLTLTLLDQAEESIQGIGSVTLLDPEEIETDTKTIALGTEGYFILSKFARPGIWTIKAEAEGLSEILTINIVEQSKLDSWITGQILNILNTGNIPYKGELKIIAEDKEKLEKVKNINLDIEENRSFDLADFFQTGTYKITVPLTNSTFENIKIIKTPSFFEKLGNSISGITGGAVYNIKKTVTSTIGLIFTIIITLVLVGFIVRGAINRSKKNKIREREVQLAMKRKTEIMREKGQIPSTGTKKQYANDPEMKSFVQTLAKRAAEEPKPFKPIPKGEGTYINLNDDKQKEKGGNVFGSMFDF